MLFICEKKSIQCNNLAYFLNVLPNTWGMKNMQKPHIPHHQLSAIEGNGYH